MARASNQQRNDSRKQEEAARALVVQAPRLPYPIADAQELGFSEGQWKALVDAIYPSAKTVDGVVLALRYCRARDLDPFKRAVHVVPMWNSVLRREVETVWPGINELRTTASRTKSWAGNDECAFGPTLKRPFQDSREIDTDNGKKIQREECPSFEFPEWAQVTVYRMIDGRRVGFVGPKVRFVEIFSGQKGLRVPNARWQQSPFGQLEKCAEAAALRRAFPEELANDYTAEEMEGKDYSGGPTIEGSATDVTNGDQRTGDAKPTRESVQTEWEKKGIPKDCWEVMEQLQPAIDSPTATVSGLKDGKERYVDMYAPDWPAAALDELELRFDTAIVRASGELDGNQEEEGDEQKAD